MEKSSLHSVAQRCFLCFNWKIRSCGRRGSHCDDCRYDDVFHLLLFVFAFRGINVKGTLRAKRYHLLKAIRFTAFRPRHHLPTGRGGRLRLDGARHPHRHPPIASASFVRMIAIHAQTQRKWQDRSVGRAEKHRRSGRKGLVQQTDSGDLHVKRHATWAMSAYCGNSPSYWM